MICTIPGSAELAQAGYVAGYKFPALSRFPQAVPRPEQMSTRTNFAKSFNLLSNLDFRNHLALFPVVSRGGGLDEYNEEVSISGYCRETPGFVTTKDAEPSTSQCHPVFSLQTSLPFKA